MGRRRRSSSAGFSVGDRVTYQGEDHPELAGALEVVQVGGDAGEHLQVHAPERELGCVWVPAADCAMGSAESDQDEADDDNDAEGSPADS